MCQPPIPEFSLLASLDHSANSLKILILSADDSIPLKSSWLTIFNCFRILRNLYSNAATESTGQRLLGWINLFQVICLRPSDLQPSEPYHWSIPSSIKSDIYAFSISDLETYASVIMQLLSLGSYDILNENGCDDHDVAVLEAAMKEMERDLKCMLRMEAASHRAMEEHLTAARQTSTEALISAMDNMALEFSDSVQELNSLVAEMDLN